jgi:phage shock protein E
MASVGYAAVRGYSDTMINLSKHAILILLLSSCVALSDGPTVYRIDVRTLAEFNQGHIEGAIHIPHTQIAKRIGEVTADKHAEIRLYCAVGGRAGRAKATLEKQGFVNVINEGGYRDVLKALKK